MGDIKKKPWEQNLEAAPEQTTEAKKPWEQDLVSDEKKNGGSELDSNVNSAGSTSESTDAPLASETPSTGAIKQQNVQNANLDLSNVIKQRMDADLPGKSQAYKDSYIDHLSKNGYDRASLEKYASDNSPEEKQAQVISKYTPFDPVKPITDWASSFVKKSAEKIGQGGDLINQGVYEVLDALGGQTGAVSQKAHDVAHGGLTTVKGAGEVAMNTIPAAVGFNAATDAIKTTAEKNLSPEHAATVSKVMDAPFTLVSKTAHALNIDPAKGSNMELLTELADFGVAALLMHGTVKAAEGVKDIISAPKALADLKDISQKVAENKATPEEQDQFNKTSEAVDKVTLADIKAQAEKSDTPQAKEIVAKIDEATKSAGPDNEELHDKLAELQAKTQDPTFTSLPPEVQQGIHSDIESAVTELAQKEKAKVDSHLEEAQKNAQVADLDTKIADATKALEGTGGVVKESIQKTIDNLEKQKEEITKPAADNIVAEEPVKTKENATTPEIRSVQTEPSAIKESAKAEPVKESFKKLTDRQKTLNSIHDQVDEYNSMKNGRLGKEKPEGLKLRNDIEQQIRDMEDPNVKFDQKNGYISVRGGSGQKLRAVNTEFNNQGEAKDYVPLEQRDKATKDVFNTMNENGAHTFPVIKGADGKRMSQGQLKSAIADVLADRPSNGANELLNQMDDMVKNDAIVVKATDGVDMHVPVKDVLFSIKPENHEHYLLNPEEESKLAEQYDKHFEGLSEEEKAQELEYLTHGNTEDTGIAKSEENAGDTTDESTGGKTQDTSESKSEKPKPKVKSKERDSFDDHPDTGISEAARKKQRAELGLEEPVKNTSLPKETFESLNTEANRLIDSKEVDYNKLAESIINEGHTTDGLGKAILNRGKTELGNKLLDAKVKINEARANGDLAADQKYSDEWLQHLSDFNNIDKALELEGTKAGRNLAAMKQSMKEDYSTGSLYSRFKKANGDQPLPKEIIDRLDTYAAQIEELNVRIKAAEELAEAQGKQIEDISKSKPVTPKEKIAKIREKRKALFDEWKQYRDGNNGVVKNSPLPIGDEDIKFIAKIALSYIEDGYATTMAVAKKLRSDVKSNMGVKLSEEDIAKVLDTEIDGKKVVDNFENTGIPTNKKSLLDLVNKTENDTYDILSKGEKDKLPEDKDAAAKKEQQQKESAKKKEIVQNTNKSLNDLKIAREKLKRKVNNEQSAIEMGRRSNSDKLKEGIANVLNVPRSLMSSFDFSAPLRQGLVASAAHPTSALKAAAGMFKDFASQKNFDDWIIKYKMSPEHELAKKSELYVADPQEASLNGHEEAFMSNLAEKIPLIKYGIKASERAYVGYLNKLRTDVFKNMSDQLSKDGKTFESHPQEFKALADFINSATGRGKLPNKTIEDAAPLLNSVFFSPRLIASRINLLNPFYYGKMPKSVRAMALKDMGKFAAVAATTLALAKLGGAQVETDPRSSDFGKIKVGDTRYDVLGGFQQYIRAATQIALGQKKSTADGKIVDLNPAKFPYQSRGSVLANFARVKLSPSAGIGIDFLTGRDAVGLPVTWQNELYTHFTPLQLQDGLQAYKSGGALKVLQVLAPSMFGVGVQTYSSKQTKQKVIANQKKMAGEE